MFVVIFLLLLYNPNRFHIVLTTFRLLTATSVRSQTQFGVPVWQSAQRLPTRPVVSFTPCGTATWHPVLVSPLLTGIPNPLALWRRDFQLPALSQYIFIVAGYPIWKSRDSLFLPKIFRRHWDLRTPNNSYI